MLENTLYSLQKKKKLTIGYFGGSITEGGCAADPNIGSYRALVTSWFAQQYPDADVREIQAAISGTGSELGMHRCEDDLLAGEPDLIFLEYTVNDYGLPYEKLCAQYETIIRKIYQKNPFADIVVVMTITQGICQDMENGLEFISRSAHTAIAHHYKLPLVDVGTVLWAATMREGGDFLRYTADTVHPNDAGHAMYADTICTRLCELLNQEVPASPKPILLESGTFCKHLHMNAHMEDCLELKNAELNGFVPVDQTMCGRYPRYIESSTPGDSISFTFIGENAGFYWIKANDSGDVLVSVDGGEEKRISGWDIFCPGGSRASYSFFAENLRCGVHKVVIRIAETHAPESEGTAVRIGAILVS